MGGLRSRSTNAVLDHCVAVSPGLTSGAGLHPQVIRRTVNLMGTATFLLSHVGSKALYLSLCFSAHCISWANALSYGKCSRSESFPKREGNRGNDYPGFRVSAGGHYFYMCMEPYGGVHAYTRPVATALSQGKGYCFPCGFIPCAADGLLPTACRRNLADYSCISSHR